VGGGEVVGQEKKGNNGDVVVAAAVDSTTVDDDHSGGGGGPIVGPETKGNDDVADAMVDDKNKIRVDDVTGKERACKVIVGGGEVVGQEKKGNNDDVVVAAAIGSTSVDEDIADSVDEHPGVIPSNTHFAKIGSNCEQYITSTGNILFFCSQQSILQG
jgi:hypothetical protein